MASKSAALISTIDANVSAWMEDRITYEDFQARQRTAWDAVDAAGPRVKSLVLRVLRDRLPAA